MNLPRGSSPPVGGRVIFDGTFVGRLDAGLGLDPVETESGTVRQELTPGVYLCFGHLY